MEEWDGRGFADTFLRGATIRKREAAGAGWLDVRLRPQTAHCEGPPALRFGATGAVRDVKRFDIWQAVKVGTCTLSESRLGRPREESRHTDGRWLARGLAFEGVVLVSPCSGVVVRNLGFVGSEETKG